MKERSAGFTLIEILVVIAILAILLSVIYAALSTASAKSRDTERQADLREVQSALELYKLRYGRYPEGCNGPGRWSGQAGTNYACPSGNEYIVGLAPDFLPLLPLDSNRNGADSGYVYTTDADGKVYKFMARNTVETDTVDYTHEFKSCDVTTTGGGICVATHPNNGTPAHCLASSAVFQSSYAVWEGYATPSNPTPARVEQYTEDVICDIP